MEWIDKLKSVMGCEITQLQRVFSRRNKVYRVSATLTDGTPKTYIVKVKNNETSVKEARLLTLLKAGGVEVPRVYWYGSGIIVLEYIDGVLLADLVFKKQWNTGHNDDWIKTLARWLCSLHSFMRTENRFCFCMADLNLRNFIYHNDKFFGYDFEEILFDRPERDLGGLCAFILNNEPMFADYKFDIVKQLVSSYMAIRENFLPGESIDLDLVMRSLINEMRLAMERRKKQWL